MGKEIYPFFLPICERKVFIGNKLFMERHTIKSIKSLTNRNYTQHLELNVI